jgi:signal transduction histidine kinase
VLRLAPVPHPDDVTSSQRQQTDESLQAEREKADAALLEGGEGIDEVADSVITLARQRADEVLAAARARVDGTARRGGGPASPSAPLARERERENQVLQGERDAADEVLRQERDEHVALLATERGETDRDLDEERERADDALATRDEFLAIVSHDLRNLLNTVLGFAGLITQEVAQEPHGARILADAQRIQRSGARMYRLIGDLVDVASIHAGTLAVTRREQTPAAVVEEAIDTFSPQAAARGVTLRAELVPPLGVAPFDAARVLQVLGNLLSNALKFTPPRGTVVLRVEPVEGSLRFSVSDTGPGIPPERLEAIFDRYLQVRADDRRGVGLGLYISRCIVQGHGGRIWAESTPGQGATLRFTLPR